MDGRTNEWMDKQAFRQTDGRTNARTNERTDDGLEAGRTEEHVDGRTVCLTYELAAVSDTDG